MIAFLLGAVAGIIFMALVPTPWLDAKVLEGWRYIVRKIP